MLRNLQKKMEPCSNIPTEHDSGSIRESVASQQPELKYSQSYSDGSSSNYTHKSLLTFHSPESVLHFTIIMASPQALVQLNNSTDAERVTRKQHYSRDVNTSHVNRG